MCAWSIHPNSDYRKMKIIYIFYLLPLVFVFDVTDCILFFQGRTTACDICDGVSTNSVRNTLCCLKFSQCCMPNSLDEYNAQVDREARSGLVNFPDRSKLPVATTTTPNANNNNNNKRKRRKSPNNRKKTSKQPQQRQARKLMQTINNYFISLS